MNNQKIKLSVSTNHKFIETAVKKDLNTKI